MAVTITVQGRPPYISQQLQQQPLLQHQQTNELDGPTADLPPSLFHHYDHDETAPQKHKTGASHLSEWCRLSKEHFLYDVKHNRAQDWIVVTGNEAGGQFCLTVSISAIPLPDRLIRLRTRQTSTRSYRQ